VHADHIGGVASVLARYGKRRVSKMPWPGKDERYGLALEPIRAGDVFRTDGATLRALHTPGHAQDHICFYLEEERALFTGDVVLGAGTTVIPLDGGDMGLYLESLARMLELELTRIYPGHGPFIADPVAKLHEYIAHRREREQQIVAASAPARPRSSAWSAHLRRHAARAGRPPAIRALAPAQARARAARGAQPRRGRRGALAAS
jgi:glyoxylase-like metal-dependent hydrolase (beta-lactamase superfamily II)